MVLLLPALLLLVPTADAGWGRKGKKSGGDGVAAATLPDVDATLGRPAVGLSGRDAVLTQEGLTREKVRFGLELDLSALRAPDDAAVAALFRHLAADPRWRVGRDTDGSTVAWLRSRGAERQVGPAGDHVSDDRCFRVSLRAGDADPYGWQHHSTVTTAQAGTSPIDLAGFSPSDPHCRQLATALRVTGGLTLEVFEAGPADSRPVTVWALQETPYLVKQMDAMTGAVQRWGYDGLSMPDGEPRAQQEPTVSLAGAGPGHLMLTGRANPGEGGLTWLRVLDAKGQPWHAQPIGAATLERVGWSDAADEAFYLQSTFAVPSGEAFAGTAELWFQPDEGEPRVLTTAEIRVPAR